MNDAVDPPALDAEPADDALVPATPQTEDPVLSRRDLLRWGIIIELGTLSVAIGLAFVSGQHFWKGIQFNWSDIAIGCLAMLPMMAVFFKAHKLRELVRELFGPALAKASVGELFLIAALAGLCEESLFRGVLEPWLANVHWFVGFFGANLLFGLAHAATRSYFLLATIFGMCLSLLAWGIGEPNLLRAIVCHAVYDFLAFLWLARIQRRMDAGTGR